MTDEPTLGELKRTMESGFATVHASLSKMVDQGVYAADQRRIDERFVDMKVDQAEEKVERKNGDKDQQVQLDKLAGNIKWAFVSVFLPVAFFAVNIYLLLARK